MADFTTIYNGMFEGVTGYLREIIDRNIGEVTNLASTPSPVVAPEGDDENEEDMYLTRIGYLKEEKKERKNPLPFTERVLSSRLNTNSNNTWQAPAGLNRVNESLGIEPSYNQSYRRRIKYEQYSYHDIYGVEHQNNLSKEDIDIILHQTWQNLMSFMYNKNHLLDINVEFFTSILNHLKDDGVIDRFSVYEDNLSQTIRVYMDKRGYRQSFFINSQEIWALNRKNKNGRENR